MKCKTFKGKYVQSGKDINNWLQSNSNIEIKFITAVPSGEYNQIVTIYYED